MDGHNCMSVPLIPQSLHCTVKCLKCVPSELVLGFIQNFPLGRGDNTSEWKYTACMSRIEIFERGGGGGGRDFMFGGGDIPLLYKHCLCNVGVDSLHSN